MINILYIEDDPTVQRAVKRTLERIFQNEGVAVTVVGAAHEAIKILASALATFGCFHYDHIISDFDLRGSLNGDAILAFIKGEWHGETKLLDTTTADGRTASQVLLERFTFFCANEEAKTLHNRYVEKPCDATTLGMALRTPGPICIE